MWCLYIFVLEEVGTAGILIRLFLYETEQLLNAVKLQDHWAPISIQNPNIFYQLASNEIAVTSNGVQTNPLGTEPVSSYQIGVDY